MRRLLGPSIRHKDKGAASIGKVIIIRMNRHILALIEEELLTMLKANPEVWLAGIKRGKQVVRAKKALERKAKGAATC